jgi:hypothetical protein
VKPLLVVVALVAAGLVAVAVMGWWRLGAVFVGVSFCLAAAMRLTLSREHLGDLAVRSRLVDAAVLLTVGFGLVALANTIPRGH